MASDRGVGLQAGYQAAWQDGFWVCDQFHAFQDLFKPLPSTGETSLCSPGKEIKAAETFANAKSEANLHKRLEHYEQPVKLVNTRSRDMISLICCSVC